MNKLPSLEDLKVFSTVANLNSFSKAAVKLHVSPAYISKRIKLLEKALDVNLFFRSPQKIVLTTEGQNTLETSLLLLEHMEQLQTRLLDIKIKAGGLLRISCSTGFGSQFINPYILYLRDLYPDLTVDFILTDKNVDIISESIDLDIRVGGCCPPHLIAKKIKSNYRILCASPDYIKQHGLPHSPSQLENKYTCIFIRERDQEQASWRLANTTTNSIENITPNSVLTINNGQVAKQWCINGHGILLRSIWDVQTDIDSGVLCNILPDWRQTADVYAVFSKRTDFNANLRVFFENINCFISDHTKWNF